MASVTITQVQLIQATSPSGNPSSLYWNTDSSSPMDIDPEQILGVSYVWDSIGKTYIAGLIQIYLTGVIQTIYSSDSYESVVAYMNPQI